jgi:hypothetical protein
MREDAAERQTKSLQEQTNELLEGIAKALETLMKETNSHK